MSKPLQIFYLEMNDPSDLRPARSQTEVEVQEISPSDPGKNQWYYQQVGAAWNWQERLSWTSQQWQTYAAKPGLSTFVALHDGEEAGYVELLEQEGGNVQIQYFGLLPDFIGKGIGGVFLTLAIRLAWDKPGARRIWLHTCTGDHPAALSNYQRRGLKLFKTETVEDG